jgi:ketosteroid isomerase-like protein
MSTTDQQNTQDKAVVDAYYQAAVRGELTAFGQYVHPDFVTTAPNYLPWGGTHFGAAWFRDNVLAHLLDDLDFSHFTYESFTGENGHVVARIQVGVTGTDDVIKISEHWEVQDEKALSLWVAYFEPEALLDKIKSAVDDEPPRGSSLGTRPT